MRLYNNRSGSKATTIPKIPLPNANEGTAGKIKADKFGIVEI